ncbi:hypothetical protein N9K98_07185 [Luminiphilus sp.]|nr:hypothetical protein [Luminiphilus sp.]
MNTYIERSMLSRDETAALRDALQSLRAMGRFKRVPQGVYQADKSVIDKCESLERACKLIKSRLMELEPGADLKLGKIWHVETTSHKSDPGKLPYLLHFDKARYLKAMIYLGNVGDGDGAICVGSTPPEAFEARRQRLPRDYKDRQLNKIELDDAGLVSELTGRAGDCVYFDTNTPHRAGVLREGHMREVLRFDFVHPNDESILKRVGSKFLSGI